MLRFNQVTRYTQPNRPKVTDQLGLCNIVHKVPDPYLSKQVRVIEVGR